MSDKVIVSGFDLPPLLCSQGGFAYNKAHIDFWKAKAERQAAEIERLQQRVRELEALANLPSTPPSGSPST
jgi:hypothetical protein